MNLKSLCLLLTVVKKKWFNVKPQKRSAVLENQSRRIFLFHFKYSKEKGDMERMIMTSACFYTHLKYMGFRD